MNLEQNNVKFEDKSKSKELKEVVVDVNGNIQTNNEKTNKTNHFLNFFITSFIDNSVKRLKLNFFYVIIIEFILFCVIMGFYNYYGPMINIILAVISLTQLIKSSLMLILLLILPSSASLYEDLIKREEELKNIDFSNFVYSKRPFFNINSKTMTIKLKKLTNKTRIYMNSMNLLNFGFLILILILLSIMLLFDENILYLYHIEEQIHIIIPFIYISKFFVMKLYIFQ